MLISVYDGAQLLEERECSLAHLADGRQAAIWRGHAFPLLASGRAIDIGGEAHPPTAVAVSTPQASPTKGVAHALVEALDHAYVLVAGSALEAESAAAELRRAGIDVLRTGRYLGDPVDGFTADWFLRIVAPSTGEPLREVVTRLFGAGRAPLETEQSLRIRLLTAELLRAHGRALRSEADVERLKLALAVRANLEAEAADQRRAVETERQQREAAEARAEAVLAHAQVETESVGQTAPPVATRTLKRVADEVEDVFEILLPRIRLLERGVNITVEFQDRRPLYRVLAELERCKTAMPDRWKSLQGVQGWIEKSKIGNGQDDQTRVYARLDRGDHTWQVLVSHKSEQDRDIAWLKRQ